MPFTNTALDAMLNGITPTHVSLHTADPGDSGANEVTGGTYARQAATFDASSGQARALSGDEVFDVPAGTTVTHAGVWASATFLASIDLTDEAFAADGTYRLLAASTSLTIGNV